MKSTKVIIRSPAFRDPDLEVPSPLHLERCPAVLDRMGRAGMRRCRCGSAAWFLDVGEEVGVMLEQGVATLVLPRQRGPVWVETYTLASRRSEVETESVDRSVTDISVLRAYLADNPRKKWPRRRTPPRGGDIVFVRKAFRSGERAPLRYLFCVRRDGVSYAALLDPEVNPSMAMRPDWSHLTMFPLVGDPWRDLMVAFPLPDKTENPGWKEVSRAPVFARR